MHYKINECPKKWKLSHNRHCIWKELVSTAFILGNNLVLKKSSEDFFNTYQYFLYSTDLNRSWLMFEAMWQTKVMQPPQRPPWSSHTRNFYTSSLRITSADSTFEKKIKKCLSPGSICFVFKKRLKSFLFKKAFDLFMFDIYFIVKRFRLLT